MSARRMAAEQPESYAFSSAAEKEINMWVKKYPKDRQRSALIPALWIAQKDAGGWLPEVAMRAVADKLSMAYIRVYEVVTFYTMFNWPLWASISFSSAGQRHAGCAAPMI